MKNRTLLILLSVLGIASLLIAGGVGWGAYWFINFSKTEAALSKGRNAFREGRTEEALTSFNEALRRRPENAQALHARGICLFRLNRHKEAADDFTEVIRLDPKLPAARSMRALVWMQLGQTKEAEQDLTEAIRLDPSNPHFYFVRAGARDMLGRPEDALKDLDRAIQIDPGEEEYYLVRGSMLAKQRQYEKALENLNHLLQMNPSSADAHMGRANVYDRQGEHRLALQELYAALNLDSAKAEIWNNIAWMLATCPADDIRNGPQAVEYAMKACELEGWKDSYSVDTLAAAYAEAGDFQKAVEWQTKVLQYPQRTEKATKGMKERLELYKQGKPYREHYQEDHN